MIAHVNAHASRMSTDRLTAMRESHEEEYKNEVVQMYKEISQRDQALLMKFAAL